jgi:hypothetical protein
MSQHGTPLTDETRAAHDRALLQVKATEKATIAAVKGDTQAVRTVYVDLYPLEGSVEVREGKTRRPKQCVTLQKSALAAALDAAGLDSETIAEVLELADAETRRASTQGDPELVITPAKPKASKAKAA